MPSWQTRRVIFPVSHHPPHVQAAAENHKMPQNPGQSCLLPHGPRVSPNIWSRIAINHPDGSSWARSRESSGALQVPESLPGARICLDSWPAIAEEEPPALAIWKFQCFHLKIPVFPSQNWIKWVQNCCKNKKFDFLLPVLLAVLKLHQSHRN